MMQRTLMLSLAVLALAGCGPKAPGCNDEQTLGLVKNIYFQTLTRKQNEPSEDASLLDAMKRDVKLAITTVRTAASDEKVGKLTCQATLEATLPASAATALQHPLLRDAMARDPSTRNLKLDGLVLSADVQYTSQMTDDRKEHLVELSDFQGIVDMVSALGSMGAFGSQEVDSPEHTETAQ